MANAATSGRLTRDELEESLLFFRRQLAAKIIVAFIHADGGRSTIREAWKDLLPALVEDMANAVCERLAARETGDPNGYKE